MLRAVTKWLPDRFQPVEAEAAAQPNQIQEPVQQNQPQEPDLTRRASQFVFENNPIARSVTRFSASAREAAASARETAEETVQTARAKKEKFVLEATQAADGLKEKAGNVALKLIQPLGLDQIFLKKSFNAYNKQLADEIQSVVFQFHYNADLDDSLEDDLDAPIQENPIVIKALNDFQAMCKQTAFEIQPEQSAAIKYPSVEEWNPAIQKSLISWFFSIYIESNIINRIVRVGSPNSSEYDFTDLLLRNFSLNRHYPHLYPSLAEAFKLNIAFFNLLSMDAKIAEDDRLKGIYIVNFAEKLVEEGQIEAAICIKDKFMKNKKHIVELNEKIAAARLKPGDNIAAGNEDEEEKE